MAEESAHDVVNQEQSVGDLSPSDASATKPNHQAIEGEGEGDQSEAKNDDGSQAQSTAAASGSTTVEDGGDNVTNGLPDVCFVPSQMWLSIITNRSCRSPKLRMGSLTHRMLFQLSRIIPKTSTSQPKAQESQTMLAYLTPMGAGLKVVPQKMEEG